MPTHYHRVANVPDEKPHNSLWSNTLLTHQEHATDLSVDTAIDMMAMTTQNLLSVDILGRSDYFPLLNVCFILQLNKQN